MKIFETTVEIDDDGTCYIHLPNMRIVARVGWKNIPHSTLTFGDPDVRAVNVGLDPQGRVVGVELVGFKMQAAV